MCLQAENITVVRGGTVALDCVSTYIGKGEKLLLVGGNAAGKSTLINSISGLDRIRQGRVLVDGIDITSIPAYRRNWIGISTVLENGRLFRSLTVYDNIILAACKEWRREVEKRAHYLLDVLAVELKDKLKLLAGSLSGGEQRMLSLVRALMNSPRYLLVDDVSLGLSQTVAERVRSYFFSREMASVGLLLVDHDFYSLVHRVDRIIVLEGGRKILDISECDGRYDKLKRCLEKIP